MFEDDQIHEVELIDGELHVTSNIDDFETIVDVPAGVTEENLADTTNQAVRDVYMEVIERHREKL